MASPRIRPAPRNVESSSRSLSNCRPQISRWVVASKDAPWRPTRTDDILFLVHLQQQQQKICLNKKTAVRTCAFRRKSIEVRGDAQVNKGCAVLSSFSETPLITPLFFSKDVKMISIYYLLCRKCLSNEIEIVLNCFLAIFRVSS